MSLIEQAAKRLDELRRAGIGTAETPEPVQRVEGASAAERVPTPEATIRSIASATSGFVKQEPSVSSDRIEPGEVETLERPKGPRRGPFNLDLENLKRRGFVTPDEPRAAIASEFRVIKRPLLRNARDKSITKGNLVMVTSAMPGEGKTFTAINLALSIAMEVGTTVLLVDGDVAHPDFPKQLGTPNEPGLLDVLCQDDLDVGDVLLRTSIPNLSILPAGARHRRATELLAGEPMAILLRELASRYQDRIIVFDSPPLLPTTEARVLASQMGQIVMVIAAEQTRHQVVKQALATIESCDVVMTVLNKAQKGSGGGYYGYYSADAKD